MKKENKVCVIAIRVTPEQKKTLILEASKLGISLSAYIQMIFKLVIG